MKPLGKMSSGKALLISVHVGSCDAEDGSTYSMDLAGGVSPRVKSDKTGKVFTFNWEAFVELAIAEGIDIDKSVVEGAD